MAWGGDIKPDVLADSSGLEGWIRFLCLMLLKVERKGQSVRPPHTESVIFIQLYHVNDIHSPEAQCHAQTEAADFDTLCQSLQL